MPLPIEDLVEIHRLVSRYNFAFDRRDADAFAECFTADGRFMLGEKDLTRGRDGLAEYVAAAPVPGQIRHVITPVLADGEATTATSQAYCTVFASSAGNGYQMLAQRRFDPDPA